MGATERTSSILMSPEFSIEDFKSRLQQISQNIEEGASCYSEKIRQAGIYDINGLLYSWFGREVRPFQLEDIFTVWVTSYEKALEIYPPYGAHVTSLRAVSNLLGGDTLVGPSILGLEEAARKTHRGISLPLVYEILKHFGILTLSTGSFIWGWRFEEEDSLIRMAIEEQVETERRVGGYRKDSLSVLIDTTRNFLDNYPSKFSEDERSFVFASFFCNLLNALCGVRGNFLSQIFFH